MGTNQQHNRKTLCVRRSGQALAMSCLVAALATIGGASAFQAPAAPPAGPGAQAAARPDRMGAISKISGDTYTLTSRTGDVTVQIPETVPVSGVRDAKATRDDLKVGARIGVFGTAKDDGTLVATRVIVLPARRGPGAAAPAVPSLSPEALAASKALLEKDTPEITVDTTGAPDLAGFASRARGICEAVYPAIAAYLRSDGFTPPRKFTLTFREMDGVAYTSGDGCHFAAAYFRTHADDYGAVVHEMTHVIQSYNGDNPGWLVEAVDDYVRFYRYEPVSKALHFAADQVKDEPQAYQVGAQFLDWAQTKYDGSLVPELNAAMRKGTYSDEIWKQKTGKTIAALWAEWKASLPAAAPKAVASRP